MENPYQVMQDIEILPSFFPVPTIGYLAVNSYVIKAKEPVLVDTGMGIESEQFIKALESVIDLQDLGLDYIHMYADLFTVSRDQVMELCQRMIDEKINLHWMALILLVYGI